MKFKKGDKIAKIRNGILTIRTVKDIEERGIMNRKIYVFETGEEILVELINKNYVHLTKLKENCPEYFL